MDESSPLLPLIGREAETAGIRDLLTRRTTRLVTVVGPPGVGKTRLAQAASDGLEGTFAEGRAFVDLAPVADAAGVLSAIAQTLRLREGAGSTPLDTLREHLAERRLLLVLDNFEHVLAARGEVAGLLAACPGLRVLVTSRVPLNVRWEQRYPVAPLACPDPRRVYDPQDLASYPAVALFVERARTLDPAFALDARNARAVAAICAQLDGLPLAIELAAARVNVLSPQAILERLGGVLDLLTEAPGDVPGRHRTLRAAVEWSYRLLSPGDQRHFRQLSVFAGGFTLEAAEALTGAALDALVPLANHNLLSRDQNPGADGRFRILETVRAFAAEVLAASGEEEDARRRHAVFFCDLAERAEPELTGSRQAEWLSRLDADADNLLAAMRWAAGRDPSRLLRLAGSLARYWLLRGRLSEGRRWLEAAVAASEGRSEADLAKALGGAATLMVETGEFARAAEAAVRSLEICRRLGDERGQTRALSALGNARLRQARYDEARAIHEEGLALFQKMGDPRGTAQALNNLGAIARLQGDLDSARRFYEESLRLKREEGSPSRVALALNNLGEVELDAANVERAELTLRESLEIFESAGARAFVVGVLANLGRASRLADDLDTAEERYRRSLVLSEETQQRAYVSECLEGLAAVAVERGHLAGAAWLLGAATALRDAAQSPVPPVAREEYDRLLQRIRSGAEFAAAYSRGYATPAEEIIAKTLSGAADAGAPASNTRVEINLLGPFRFRVGGEDVSDGTWGRPRALAILQYLLLRRPRPVPAEELAEVFWPEAPSVERTTLYATLTRLRNGLEASGLGASALRRERGGYRIDLPAGAVVDFDAFNAALRPGPREMMAADALSRYEGALLRYSGELLEDAPYAGWAALERDAVRARWVEACLAVASSHKRAGRVERALEWYQRALSRDATLEDAHRGAMRCYAGLGHRDLALRQYDRCVRILRDELDAPPDAETVALRDAIARPAAP
ncbi:MAG: tetratricopeptide repeat protein [Armatimonadota bacterium]|nr:tetratricopeptide repeat protein [Armatimonadota bacterium]MDR7450968.1 tetratricopeptide repeat protein [Armatimonadota bacterium]MDR7466011.1 tetratricopeptide repeat protein [Armatimonadota bacterium]MDR7494076.1 tetratricopeptide repeat protein [Armatimonadota bacterium]MDR7504057.1 tetratricopeptide repeat protein [Armatimonadota bacterium]